MPRDQNADLDHALAAVDAKAKPTAKVSPVAHIELIDATSLRPEPIRWLWPGFLACGKLTLIAGKPGTGKTTAALSLAASVTTGRNFPDGSRAKPGNVLIWSGEDDPTDTLLPRLLAAGADPKRIRFVGDLIEGGLRYPFDPAKDMDRLAAAAVGELSLIVVDPLVSAVSGDSHKGAEVRRGLMPLVDLASRLDASLIGITHYSKSTQGRDPLERVTGSIAFAALARVVIGTSRQQSDDGEARLIFARIKSNIGPDGGGFLYAMEQARVPGYENIETNRIVWGAPVEGDARELLSEPEDDDQAAERRDAVDWLQDLLRDCSRPAKDIKREATKAGLAWRTVQRARTAAGIETRREGFASGAVWSLRASKPNRATICATHLRGTNGANGTNGMNDDAIEVRI